MSNSTKRARHSLGVIRLVEIVQVKEWIFIFFVFYGDFDVFFCIFPFFIKCLIVSKKVWKYFYLIDVLSMSKIIVDNGDGAILHSSKMSERSYLSNIWFTLFLKKLIYECTCMTIESLNLIKRPYSDQNQFMACYVIFDWVQSYETEFLLRLFLRDTEK